MRANILAAAALVAVAAWPGPRAEAAETKKLPVGEPAPNFRLRTLDNSVVRLTDFAFEGRRFRKKPRPVLLDFFRTDCQPCLKALPELVELHEKYDEQGLKILVIALLEKEDGRAKLERYLAGKDFPFTVVLDPTDYVAEKYLGKTVSLPATFLINRRGILQEAKYDAKESIEEAFGDALTEVLKKPKKNDKREK